MALKHRYDIDGLRSIAVLPIVLFHAGVDRLHGGFIGVDIFFVISGFLITSIIMRELETGDFSIMRFYHRRIVRIFPALFVMLGIVLAVGCKLMFTQELRALVPSASAAAAFVSNLYFWKTAGYFSLSSEAKPLLHTWSLGVEEQFYIFFPLLLILCHRFARSYVRYVVLAVTLLSFAISLWATPQAANSAFYLLPSRAWELGIGACVALGLVPVLESIALRTGLAVLGAVLIVIGLFVIKAEVGFPAPAGLLPSIGAALLIAYGEQGPTARALSTAPAIWIGKISYSLYLWHWPIITFYRLLNGTRLDMGATVLLVLASVAAGAVSYYCVEQPFQRGLRARKPLVTVPAGLVAIAVLCLAGYAISRNAPRIVNVPPAIAKIANFVEYPQTPANIRQTDWGNCFTGEGMQFNVEKCFTPQAGSRNLLLLGDSHAAQYRQSIEERFPDFHLVQITVSGCRPLIATVGEKRCTDVIREVYDKRLPQSEIHDIILAGRWKPEEFAATVATARALREKGYNVLFIGPTVEYGGDFPMLLARAEMHGNHDDLARFANKDRFALDRRLDSAIRAVGVPYFSEIQTECPGGKCRYLTSDGSPYHFDYGHLTVSATREIARHMPTF